MGLGNPFRRERRERNRKFLHASRICIRDQSYRALLWISESEGKRLQVTGKECSGNLSARSIPGSGCQAAAPDGRTHGERDAPLRSGSDGAGTDRTSAEVSMEADVLPD